MAFLYIDICLLITYDALLYFIIISVCSNVPITDRLPYLCKVSVYWYTAQHLTPAL